MLSTLFNKYSKSLLVFALALLLWFELYHETIFSMVEIWWRSETFAHGFLIFPISIYLIWDKRQRFYHTDKNPSLIFSLFLLMLIFVWGLAKSVDVQVIQQLMVVLMIPVLVGAVFGFKMLKQYLFPLLYLLFAVPFGEFLIPRLQDVTAHMTVWGLQLTGVPVFSEGMFISIPSGDFEVAVACSGIRYLIASLALGTLYAYLTYTKLYKQLIFVVVSLVVPVIANGVRAYGIVLIAHLSDMKYATGIDHIIYGWLFFGVVIFILFYIGSFWQDNTESISDSSNEQVETSLPKQQTVSLNYRQILPLIILFFGPLMTVWMSYEPSSETISTQAPQVETPWINTYTKPEKWQPVFNNADSEITTVYNEPEKNIQVYYYSSEYQFETQDKELVNAVNQLFRHKKWVQISRQSVNYNPRNKLDEVIVRRNTEKLLIWNWYEVLGLTLTNPIKIKIAQALGKLTGTHRGGKFKAIAISFHDSPQQARKQLGLFLQQNPQFLLKSAD